MGRPLSACMLVIAAVFAPLSPMSNDDVAGIATYLLALKATPWGGLDG